MEHKRKDTEFLPRESLFVTRVTFIKFPQKTKQK